MPSDVTTALGPDGDAGTVNDAVKVPCESVVTIPPLTGFLMVSGLPPYVIVIFEFALKPVPDAVTCVPTAPVVGLSTKLATLTLNDDDAELLLASVTVTE